MSRAGALSFPSHSGLVQPNLLSQIFAGQPIEHWSDGETLFLQDDPSDRVFGIVSGAVEISLLSPDGRKIVANLVTAPSLVGEIGALDGGTRTATATCSGACRLQSLSRVSFLERVTSTPALSAAVIDLLCSRIRWISSEFEDQVMLKVDARLAKRLLSMGAVLADGREWIEISQSDLADFLGATRESVNKHLKRWREARLIDIRRSGVRILDREGLRAIGSGDPSRAETGPEASVHATAAQAASASRKLSIR